MIKRLFFLAIIGILFTNTQSQTTLEEATNFHVKTIYGEPIWLFPLLDDENKIVVIDFFSTTCGPCQDYAPDFQACYEKFGYNEGNVYFLGINWGNDNLGVYEFDSIFGLTFPTVSGSQGGGNIVYQDYDILSYPTVIVITPDHHIDNQHVWYPDEENITDAVIAAGGMYVNTEEMINQNESIIIFPNPAKSKGTFKFNLERSTQVSLSIINMLGTEVYKSEPRLCTPGKNSVSFDVSYLKNGFYFVKLISNSGTISTSRVSVYH